MGDRPLGFQLLVIDTVMAGTWFGKLIYKAAHERRVREGGFNAPHLLLPTDGSLNADTGRLLEDLGAKWHQCDTNVPKSIYTSVYAPDSDKCVWIMKWKRLRAPLTLTTVSVFLYHFQFLRSGRP